MFDTFFNDKKYRAKSFLGYFSLETGGILIFWFVAIESIFAGIISLLLVSYCMASCKLLKDLCLEIGVTPFSCSNEDKCDPLVSFLSFLFLFLCFGSAAGGVFAATKSIKKRNLFGNSGRLNWKLVGTFSFLYILSVGLHMDSTYFTIIYVLVFAYGIFVLNSLVKNFRDDRELEVLTGF